ncbi:MAG: MazG nucleotide pyrophosphohydrolase domain-containing protein [Candidatus Omnitrophota bacterium]|jgi:tetrapyrrole methylase family protein/MazG family protein
MKEFDKLVEIIKLLRSPKGCPWDRAQKINNYKKFLLEEAYELIDEINQDKPEAVKEELGDLFIILVVLAEMFDEKRKFTLAQVLNGVSEKLISRHPHVFASEKLKTDKEVLAYWIKHKAKHKKRKTIKERLPRMAPALLLADIFFKEYASIEKNKKQKRSQTLQKIKKNTELLNKRYNKKNLLSEILFDIAAFASANHIDLENALREKVIKEADKAAY